MPQGITYDVRANLKTAGSFQREAIGMARAADTVGKSYASMSSRLVSAGERVRGTFGQTAREWARMGAMAAGGALVGGVAAAASEGVRFNSEMEQGRLGLATMYQLFGVAGQSQAVMTGQMTEFAKASELAAGMQAELYDIAKKSPATYEDIATAYSAMAPGVTGVTKDLKRQRDLMEKVSLLAFTTGGDYKQMGADVGRIVRGLAGADVAVFSQLEPNLREAFKKVTGKETEADFAQMFNKLAKQSGDTALKIVEVAVDGVSKEAATAFGKSFGGLASTMKSEGMTLAGAFAAPLMDSLKRAMSRATGKVGISTFGGGMDTMENAASFAGQQLSKAADKLFDRLHRGAWYVATHWRDIATKIQEAGVLAGAALKAASVVATARLVAGYGMIIAGKGMAAAQVVGAGMRRGREGFGAMARRRHMAIGRGMGGRKGGGGLGMLGRGLSRITGKIGGGKGGLRLFRGMDKTILKFATLAPLIAGVGVAAGGLALAFSGVAVVVGGLAAYVATSWDEIKASLVGAIESGKISLLPLITSLYTFYERLRLVGVAMFGGTDAATVMVSGLDMLTGAVDFASMVLGGMIDIVAYGIEAFGAFRLAFSALLQLIGDGLRVMSKIPKVGDGLDGAIASIDGIRDSAYGAASANLKTADRFHKAADAVRDAQLTPMQFAAAQKKAKDLQQSLSDMLAGKDKDKDKRAPGGTKIGKVEVVINTTDPDPDRLFAAFIKKTAGLADRRVQAYGAIEQGT